MMRLCALLLLLVVTGVVRADKLFYEIRQPSTDDVICPNQASKCPAGTTCCQITSDKWDCCPFVQATCCPDKVHCCPQGYSCNAAKQQCVKAVDNDTIPWTRKEPASINSASSSLETNPTNSLVCADGVSVCPGTAACCRTYSGSFRCCTYPNDVCCSDGYSCCPRCTICDKLHNICIAGIASEKWETMTPSLPAISSYEQTQAVEKVPASKVTDSEDKQALTNASVVWCDGSHYCYDGQTCCRLPSGSWDCCPVARATCCIGSVYCCPPAQPHCTVPAGGCY